MQSSHYCTALPILVFSSSSCLPSLVKAALRYLNFSICFSVAQLTCNTHRSDFLKDEVPQFKPRLFSFWLSSRIKSSANSRRLILAFQFVVQSSAWLHLSILFMLAMKKRGDKTHSCRSLMSTWNDFDCLPFTRILNLRSAVK